MMVRSVSERKHERERGGRGGGLDAVAHQYAGLTEPAAVPLAALFSDFDQRAKPDALEVVRLLLLKVGDN